MLRIGSRTCIAFGSFLLFALLLTGCSYQYVDTYGTRHVWGLVHVTSREIPDDQSDIIAQQVTTLGMALLRLPHETGFAIGYTRNFDLQIADNTAGQIAVNLVHPTRSTYKNSCTLIKENQ